MTAPATIPYAPRRRMHWKLRLSAALVVIAALGVFGYRHGRSVYGSARLFLCQEMAISTLRNASPDTLVCDTQTAYERTSSAWAYAFSTRSTGSTWAASPTTDNAVAFLDTVEMEGEKFIVCVQSSAASGNPRVIAFLFRPATFSTPLTIVTEQSYPSDWNDDAIFFPEGERFRLYAGHLDRTNPPRMLFRYQSGEQAGTLGVRLLHEAGEYRFSFGAVEQSGK